MPRTVRLTGATTIAVSIGIASLRVHTRLGVADLRPRPTTLLPGRGNSPGFLRDESPKAPVRPLELLIGLWDSPVALDNCLGDLRAPGLVDELFETHANRLGAIGNDAVGNQAVNRFDQFGIEARHELRHCIQHTGS